MSNVYFDIRGNALKVLIIDGQAVKYAKVFEAFSLENTAEAQKTFQQISDESGVKLDMVHIIPPAAEVKIKIYKLQKMALDDARMIVKRKIMVEEGIEEPVFHLMSRDSGARQQELVAAIADPEGLKKYVMLLSGFGMKVKTLTTSFHAHLKAFERVRSDRPQTSAIFEVGTDSVEIMVVAPSQILTYEIVPVSTGEAEEALEKPDIERVRKKRLYGIIDALYKFMISYRENYADTPIEKALLCGMVDNVEKIAGAVEEGIGIQASLWNPFGEAVPNGAEFTALYGFSLGVSDGTAANLISAELLKRKQYRLSRTAVTVLFCIYIAVVVAIFFIAETRYKNSKKMLDAEIREKQALTLISLEAGKAPDLRKSLQMLAGKQTPLYEIFRYLGNNLPEGVSLDEIVFKQEGEDEILNMRFVSKYDVNIGKNKYFTRVVDSLTGSGRLSLIKEPFFSVSGDAKNSLIHFQVTCKVRPYEKKQ